MKALLIVTIKNDLKNRNLTFPVARHFTWKLQLVLNILLMILGLTHTRLYLGLYRNHSIDFLNKSMKWFLYNRIFKMKWPKMG